MIVRRIQHTRPGTVGCHPGGWISTSPQIPHQSLAEGVPETKPEQLMAPCPAEWMEAWPVGPAVGNPRSEGPGLVEPCPRQG